MEATRPDAIRLRICRRRLRMTRREMAEALGVSERALAYYEAGKPVPKAVMVAADSLSGGRSAEADFGRKRWVAAVGHLLRYGRGEPVAGRLLRERRLGELLDMLALARRGPDPEMALTDAALFRALREAATKAHLAGLLAVRFIEPGDTHRAMNGIDADSTESASPRRR